MGIPSASVYLTELVREYGVGRLLRIGSCGAISSRFRVGTVLSSDLFHHPREDVFDLARRMGVLAVEMETAGLFGLAAALGVEAASILTVTDVVGGDVALSSEERQTSLDEMIEIALESVRRD